MARSGQRPHRTLIPVVVMLAAATVVPQMAAAAPRPSAVRAVRSERTASTAQQSVRLIRRQRALSTLSQGVGHLPPGTKGPETPPTGNDPDAGAAAAAQARAERAVNRSHSVRPRSRDVVRALAKSTSDAAGVPAVRATAVSGTKPRLGTNFQGLNVYQERYVANNGNQFTVEPPDQGLCIGNGYVLETVNDVLRVFTTSGASRSVPVDLNSFYGYPAIIDRTTG